MRNLFNAQTKIGSVDITEIQIDKKSRDQIPKTLLGLQYIFVTDKLRTEVFKILEQALLPKIKKRLGRKGMSVWEIFVLSSIRMSCGTDYDHLKEIADNHANVRLMLGLSPIVDLETRYGLQTLRDNLGLLPEEAMRQISCAVVEHGQVLCGKKPEMSFFSRCDSFVTKTDVHYPTDINLLFDAIRKVITLIARFCEKHHLPGWRQSNYNLKSVKKLFRKAQRIKHSTAKNPEVKRKQAETIKQSYLAYIEIVKHYIQKTKDTLLTIKECVHDTLGIFAIDNAIKNYIEHARRQIDQTYRRVIQGEKIPHDEKVFSIFETHTEWISKGKAGVPQELGKRVAIVEDEYGFIIDHQIGDQETDDQMVLPLIRSAKKLFPDLGGSSFDKGFYTPQTKPELKKILDQVVLPKKGKLNEVQKQEEGSDSFKKARKQHSAVESAIHSLQNHGLAKCKDKGLTGFKRYVAMGILAFNIHKLGAVIQKQAAKKEKHREKYRETYNNNRDYRIA